MSSSIINEEIVFGVLWLLFGVTAYAVIVHIFTVGAPLPSTEPKEIGDVSTAEENFLREKLKDLPITVDMVEVKIPKAKVVRR